MLDFFEILKYIMSIFCVICGMLAIFTVIFLAFNKKKLHLYIDQIKKDGSIMNRINDFSILIDPMLVLYIFEDIPENKKYPHYYSYDEIKYLVNSIRNTIKSLKILLLVFGLELMILIFLYS